MTLQEANLQLEFEVRQQGVKSVLKLNTAELLGLEVLGDGAELPGEEGEVALQPLEGGGGVGVTLRRAR